MNITYVTTTATDIATRFGISRATASGFIRFLVDTGIGAVVSSTTRTGRGRAPTTVSIPEKVLTTLGSFFTTKAPTRTVTPTIPITDDSVPF